MTTPDPITTAREAHISIEPMAYTDRYCVKIGKTTIKPRYDGKPSGSPVTFTFRADAGRAAYIAREAVKIATADLSGQLEKLKAERDEALTAHEDRGFDCERLRQQITRLTSQLELACRSLQRHVTNENSFDAANALDGIQNLKDRQAKGEG